MMKVVQSASKRLVTEARASVTAMIAWLSVCLLAAAWGPTLAPEGRFAWSSFGLFGLVAALGLDAIARVRRARLEQLEMENSAVVQERRLVNLDRQSRSVCATREAMRHVTEIAQQHRQQYEAALAESTKAVSDRRSEERTACWMPVDLLLRSYDSEDESSAEATRILAYVRDLSSTGVGLCHHQPIEETEAVVRIRAGEGDETSLLATRCWCRKSEDGWFQSGWKLVEVLSTEY
ncbi:MAG: hypothetical protein K8T91_09250 [Planctomycetes bacterium]|nr:hypothetical protein [Planctomycetota bacterium]